MSLCTVPSLQKKFIKHSLHCPLLLIFASWCLPCETPALFSQHTWTPFSAVPLSNLGNILMELSAMFIGEVSHVFRKKILMGTQKMVRMTCYTPRHRMMKLAAAQFHCNFPLCHCLESFLRRFQMPSRLSFMQKSLLY